MATVFVVGAGPAGLFAAQKLALAGHEVIWKVPAASTVVASVPAVQVSAGGGFRNMSARYPWGGPIYVQVRVESLGSQL